MNSVLAFLTVLLVSAKKSIASDCRAYYDTTGNYFPYQYCDQYTPYCCGSCHFRYCCISRNSQLDQDRCDKNSNKFESAYIGYVIVGSIAFLTLLIVLIYFVKKYRLKRISLRLANQQVFNPITVRTYQTVPLNFANNCYVQTPYAPFVPTAYPQRNYTQEYHSQATYTQTNNLFEENKKTAHRPLIPTAPPADT